jgi:hypothetical protein
VVIYTGTSGSSERSGTLERSISSAPGSRVSRTHTQDRGKGSSTPGICGPRHERSFGWWDPSGSCLRTYQASFLEMMDGRGTGSVYSESFPNWGLMLGGEFIAQPTPGHPISGNGGGSWPTPRNADYKGHHQSGIENHNGHFVRVSQTTGTRFGAKLADAAALWPTPRAGKTTDEEEESWRARYEDGKVATPPLGLAVKMHHIPTPTTADVYTGNMKSSQQSDGSMHSVSLPDYVEMFPTPSTMDHIERKGMRPSRAATNRTTGYLSEEVVRWATPTGEDAKNTAGPGREKRHGPMLNLQVTKWPTPHASCSTGAGTQGREGGNNLQTATSLDQEEATGSLNPDWVEQHLMSLPEGWTRLEPLRLGTNGRHLRNYGQYGFDFFEDKGAYQEWFDAMRDGTWWDTERGLPRVTTGAENRVNRLKMLGNGIVPATLALFLIDD